MQDKIYWVISVANMKQNPKQTIVFILPNLLTSASIFSGVFSIISSIHHNFVQAAWLIVLALVFDGLDGRVGDFRCDPFSSF